MRNPFLLALFTALVLSVSAGAQDRVPSRAEFRESVRTVLQQEGPVRAALNKTKLEDFGVSYEVGKLLEKALESARLNANLGFASARRAQAGDSAFAETNYIVNLLVLRNALDELAIDLGQFAADSAKATALAGELTKLSTGTLNDSWLIGVAFNLDHIHRLETTCVSADGASRR
jgi:hypothetical protein